MVSLILAINSVFNSESGMVQVCWMRTDSSNSKVKAFKRSFWDERAEIGALEEEMFFEESEEIKLEIICQLQIINISLFCVYLLKKDRFKASMICSYLFKTLESINSDLMCPSPFSR